MPLLPENAFGVFDRSAAPFDWASGLSRAISPALELGQWNRQENAPPSPEVIEAYRQLAMRASGFEPQGQPSLIDSVGPQQGPPPTPGDLAPAIDQAQGNAIFNPSEMASLLSGARGSVRDAVGPAAKPFGRPQEAPEQRGPALSLPSAGNAPQEAPRALSLKSQGGATPPAEPPRIAGGMSFPSPRKAKDLPVMMQMMKDAIALRGQDARYAGQDLAARAKAQAAELHNKFQMVTAKFAKDDSNVKAITAMYESWQKQSSDITKAIDGITIAMSNEMNQADRPALQARLKELQAQQAGINTHLNGALEMMNNIAGGVTRPNNIQTSVSQGVVSPGAAGKGPVFTPIDKPASKGTSGKKAPVKSPAPSAPAPVGQPLTLSPTLKSIRSRGSKEQQAALDKAVLAGDKAAANKIFAEIEAGKK